jgi:hypothetical protein
MNDLAVPNGLFRKKGNKSDRYAVYKLIGRSVSFTDRRRGKVSGFVEEVYRDIFSEEIRLTINGEHYKFKEPNSIKINEKEAIFCYGEKHGKEMSDDKVFDELKKEQYRETLHDTMKRIAPKRSREVRLVLGEKKVVRKKHSLMKGIPKEKEGELK